MTINTQCTTCSTPASSTASLNLCSQCHEFTYCSQACQKEDWKKHKAICIQILNAKKTFNDISLENKMVHLSGLHKACKQELQLFKQTLKNEKGDSEKSFEKLFHLQYQLSLIHFSSGEDQKGINALKIALQIAEKHTMPEKADLQKKFNEQIDKIKASTLSSPTTSFLLKNADKILNEKEYAYTITILTLLNREQFLFFLEHPSIRSSLTQDQFIQKLHSMVDTILPQASTEENKDAFTPYWSNFEKSFPSDIETMWRNDLPPFLKRDQMRKVIIWVKKNITKEQLARSRWKGVLIAPEYVTWSKVTTFLAIINLLSDHKETLAKALSNTPDTQTLFKNFLPVWEAHTMEIDSYMTFFAMILRKQSEFSNGFCYYQAPQAFQVIQDEINLSVETTQSQFTAFEEKRQNGPMLITPKVNLKVVAEIMSYSKTQYWDRPLFNQENGATAVAQIHEIIANTKNPMNKLFLTKLAAFFIGQSYKNNLQRKMSFKQEKCIRKELSSHILQFIKEYNLPPPSQEKVNAVNQRLRPTDQQQNSLQVGARHNLEHSNFYQSYYSFQPDFRF